MFSIDALDLMTDEQKALLEEVNNTYAEFPRDETLPSLFRRQAEEHASRLAVSFQGQELSYAALDRQSNRVARLLVQLGVGPGKQVGLLMERSVEMYAALLGILKAGGAYLPLDPEAPRDRLQLLLAESDAAGVVTKSSYLTAVRTDDRRFYLLLDEVKPFQRQLKRGGRVLDRPDIEQQSAEAVPITCTPTDLAYVIYTSGSTGMPKGVMVEHRSVINLVTWLKSAVSIGPESRLLQNAPLFFDASVQHIFSALTAGAALFPVPDHIRVDPPAFVDWIEANAITHWDTVPSLWYPVVEECGARVMSGRQVFPALRAIVLGGEALQAEKVNRWRELVGTSVQLLNVYGPTEATVNATHYPITAVQQRPVVPIGRPLPNTQIFILTRELQPCMPNVEGEICIGGECLARGYVNAPATTESAFIPNPLPGKDGERLYRTGDYGRLLPDGVFEFAGRRDQQVKVRGHRIELAEVETALRHHAAVRDAAVLLTGESGNPQLAAYVTAAESSVDADELRRYLQEKLPAAAVPHHFIQLKELPLTANNKVDRQALRRIPVQSGVYEGSTVKLPATKTEKLLAQIWQEVLKVDQISVDANFFTLGGDSILSIMIRHRCGLAGIQVSTLDLFRNPTIAALAHHIDTHNLRTPSTGPEAGREAAETSLVPLTADQRALLPANTEAILPLLPLQAGMLHNIGAHRGPLYVQQHLIQYEGTIDVPALERALNVLVSRHEALRAIFRTDITAEPIQVVLSDVQLSVESSDLSALADEQQEELISASAAQVRNSGFDLASWPLFRTRVFHRSPSRFDILWTHSHMIMDGWSTSLFYSELSQLYSSIVTQSFRPFPKRGQDLSAYIRWRLTRDFAAAREFWREYLRGMIPLSLPADAQWPGGSEIGPKRRITVSFDQELTRKLEERASRTGATLNVLCLTAYVGLLRYLCRQNDITVGTVISGRDVDVDDAPYIIGNLINTIPVRVNLAGLDTLEAVAEAVASASLATKPHELLGLAEISRLEPAEAGRPIVQALFAFENYPSAQELGADELHGSRPIGVIEEESNDLPLTLLAYRDPEDGRLHFDFEYAAGLFREATVATWARLYLRICSGLVG